MSDVIFDLSLLKELTDVAGVSGREQVVADVVRRNIPNGLKITADPLGNLAVNLPGSGKKVMLLAHMDEVGLIVQRLLPQGYLQVERIGGISVRSLFGSRLELHTRKGALPAAFGVRPGHLDDHKQIDLIDCYVDIGAASKEEAEKMGVQVGDVLTWANSFQQLNRSLVRSKALDDRLGCSILINLARQLAGQRLPVDLYLMFVVREEVVLDAGLPMISSINPDIVIGIDGTLTFDTPDIAGSQSDVFLSKGPVLKWMDAIRGKSAAFLPDLELNRSIQSLADSKNIPLQHEVMTGLSTAVTPVPYTAQGIRTAALSFPLRYHHTPIECADLGDAEALTNLLLELLRSKDY